jgi:hypothetical protein
MRVVPMSETPQRPGAEDWPELSYEAGRDTLDTVHMYLQVIGKVRLALSPREPQWSNVPLYLTARGLTTSPMWNGRTGLEIDVDFTDHQVVLASTQGRLERIPLTPSPVADFYRELMARLGDLDMQVHIWPTPVEVPDPIPFPEDRTHAAYDRAWAHRFWRALSRIDLVMKEHRARFRGRTSPVHFFWGSCDLANTRFSGRPAEPPPGADLVTRLSTDAEQLSAGFWPGDSRLSVPAFYAYAYPKPSGLEDESVRPEEASWNPELGEFVLPYEVVRRSGDPRRTLLEFLESTYQAGASRLDWDPALVSSD